MMYVLEDACSTVGCNNPRAKLSPERYKDLASVRKKGKKPYTHGAFCKDCQAKEDSGS